MSSALQRTPPYHYKHRGASPDTHPEDQWIIGASIPLLNGTSAPKYYWQYADGEPVADENKVVLLLDEIARTAKDAERASLALAQEKEALKQQVGSSVHDMAILKFILRLVNPLRVKGSLPEITLSQAETFLKNDIDGV